MEFHFLRLVIKSAQRHDITAKDGREEYTAQ